MTKVEVGGSTKLGPISICLAGELTLMQLVSFLELFTFAFFFFFPTHFFIHTVYFAFFFSLSMQMGLQFWLYNNRWETFRSTTAGADDRPGALVRRFLSIERHLIPRLSVGYARH